MDPSDLQRARSNNGTSAHLMSEPITVGKPSMSGNNSMDHVSACLFVVSVNTMMSIQHDVTSVEVCVHVELLCGNNTRTFTGMQRGSS